MPMKLYKERFDGKYDGVAAPTLLAKGSVAGGENVRKINALGGWKARKGCDTHNTTAIGAASVLSLHTFEHPRNADYHFLAQCNAKITDNAAAVPTAGASFGTDITNSKTIDASQPGFSDVIKESWIYTDGGKPLVWGGSYPFCTGFLAYDSSETAYNDLTREVTNNDAVLATAVGAASDKWYVCSPEIAKEIKLDITAVNSNSVTATVKSWQSSAWSDRSATDGTASGGATMAQDGSLTWTASASDTMRVLGGIMGYWYEISFSGALSNSITILSCKVAFDLATMSSKWDGVHEEPLSVRFYDQSTGEYLDLTGTVTLESTGSYFNLDAATTSDYIYVKSVYPLTGIGLGVVPEYENDTGGGNIDLVEYWDGDSWNTLGTLIDETLVGTNSFGQTGTVWWDGAAYVNLTQKRTMPFDSIPGYWYRISWDAAPDNSSDDVRWYFTSVVPFPQPLQSYDGVVEFKGRTFLWGDLEYPNRLRYGAYDKPDCFIGADSGYTEAFGHMDPVVCAARFYNELLIFKENSIWMLEGYNPATFGAFRIADTIGCCAPKTVQVIETGYPSMHTQEPLSISIWMDTDGVYVLDGRKPRKVSLPVDHFFNTEYSTAIGAAYLDDAQSFVDRLNNEYHLILSNEGSGKGVELVYNYILDEWYPPWERTVGGANNFLVSGLNLRGTDGRYYTYGGNNAGKVFRLETDTTDKDDSDADVAIAHSIKTRGISFEPEKGVTFDFTFRNAWIEAKARTSPASKGITTTFYKNLATSGTDIATPAQMDLGNTGYNLVVDAIDANQIHCNCMTLEWSVSTADLELEIYAFLYLIDMESDLAV